MTKSKLRKKRPRVTPVSKQEAIKPFINRLHELCEVLNCEAMQHITDKKAMITLAFLRPKIGIIKSVDNDYKYDNPRKSYYNRVIKSLCRQRVNNLKGVSTQISIIDYTYLNALTLFLKNNCLRNRALSDKLLKQLNVHYGGNDAFSVALFETLMQIPLHENLPDGPLISFGLGPEIKINKNSLYGTDFNFRLFYKRPPKETVIINGQKRLVYSMTTPIYSNTHYETPHIMTKNLGHLYQGDKEILDLYIQPHALNRLRERTTPLHPKFMRLYYSMSLLNDIEPICRNHKLLIPYNAANIRIGYFVAVVSNDRIVIKTFILASHASAPEGRKFQQLTGFTKQDMSYWDITRLETFINNTMEPDNPLYSYFEESGLLPLFDLDHREVLLEDKTDTEANWLQVYDCIKKLNKHNELSQEDLQNIDLNQVMAQNDSLLIKQAISE